MTRDQQSKPSTTLEDERPAPTMDHVPGVFLWIASGIIVDAALWCALIQLPPPGAIAGALAMAAALCLSHIVILPKLVWLGRLPNWHDLAVVAQGVVVVLASIALGFGAGLLVGIATFFLGGVPGLLVGGAVAAWLAAWMMQVFPANAVVISPNQAALGGTIAPLPLLYVSSSEGTDLAGLVAMIGAGAVASLATAPLGASSWPGTRACWALAMATLISVAVPSWAFWDQVPPRGGTVHNRGELRCPAGFTPDCLANAAYVIERGPSRSWFASRRPSYTLRPVARALARGGYVEQARDLVRPFSAANREEVGIYAGAGQVALAARSRPELVADLAPLEQLVSPIALSQGLAVLAAGLSGRAEVELDRRPQVRDALPATLAGVPTLRAVADRWRTLLPGLQDKDETAARIGLARLLTDLGEHDAAASVLDPIRTSPLMEADDWLRAGDGEMALLAGIRKGRLVAVAEAATGLVMLRGGPSPGFWTPFRDAFARLPRAETRPNDSPVVSDTRILIRTLKRLGNAEQARTLADETATHARALGTPEGYALAVASYLDIGENERAGEVIAAATADLPIDALTCSETRPSTPDQSACSPRDVIEKGKWFRLAVQMHRLGRRLTSFRPAASDRNTYRSLLIEELLAAGEAPARLADMSLEVGPNHLLQAAFTRWARGDGEGARSLLALTVGKRLSPGDAQDAARLAAALDDRDLQLAFVRGLLARLRADGSQGSDAARSIAATAVYWRENLPDVPMLEATR